MGSSSGRLVSPVRRMSSVSLVTRLASSPVTQSRTLTRVAAAGPTSSASGTPMACPPRFPGVASLGTSTPVLVAQPSQAPVFSRAVSVGGKSWEAAIGALRQEVQAQLAAQQESVQEMVKSLRTEIDLGISECRLRLRQEFKAEREVMAEELERLHTHVAELRREQPQADAAAGGATGAAPPRVSTQQCCSSFLLTTRVKEIEGNLSMEREIRSTKDAELSSRLAREVEELSRCLEEQRAQFVEELAEVIHSSSGGRAEHVRSVSRAGHSEACGELHVAAVPHHRRGSAEHDVMNAFGDENGLGKEEDVSQEDIHSLYTRSWEAVKERGSNELRRPPARAQGCLDGFAETVVKQE